MEISVWQIIITAITGPVLILATKEYFDYLKRKQELLISTNKLVLERKLKLAEEAINVWKGQLGLLQIMVELFERAHEDIQVMAGKEFPKLLSNYADQLNDLGKKTWEISNAVELYFHIEQENLDYNPNKVLSEWVAKIQKFEMEAREIHTLLDNPENEVHNEALTKKLNGGIEQMRLSMKGVADVLRDGIRQLNTSISIVKQEVNNQYSTFPKK